jgi:hypothetical protein
VLDPQFMRGWHYTLYVSIHGNLNLIYNTTQKIKIWIIHTETVQRSQIYFTPFQYKLKQRTLYVKQTGVTMLAVCHLVSGENISQHINRIIIT